MSLAIYITYLEKEGPYVKVWGQTDKNLLLLIENALRQMTPHFEQGDCLITPEFLQHGTLCCAKFKDGNYYRARIVSNHYADKGIIEVIFIDYGNRDLVPVNNLRTMSRFSCNLITIPQQAHDFILAGIMHPGAVWDDQVFEMISNEIRFLDLEYQEIARIGNYNVITLSHAMQDVTTALVARGLATPVSIPMQQVVLQNMLVKVPNVAHRPEMMVFSKQPSPLEMSSPPGSKSPGLNPPTILTYKSLPLESGSEHKVFVSYVTDGPCLFSVQLVNMESKLKQLMTEINNLPLQPLDEYPLPGCVCLARSSEDGYICRAVVTNMVDGNCKVFYVDFGNTEELPINNLYQIQFKYIIPKVMATRFALNGLANSVVSIDMKIAFKSFVTNKVLIMRVQSQGPGLPVCDLWDEKGVNALDFVKCVALKSYPSPVSLTRGINQEVKVSFVYGCKHFYVQLKNKEDDLNNLMQKLQEVCSASPVVDINSIEEGSLCNALYAADGMYYRAVVTGIEGSNIKVRYVDYGNVELVDANSVKAPDVDLITVLRPQAIECCLNGYQNMDNDEERDNIFEELILEQDFNMKVVEIQETKILVDLIDKNHYNLASLLLEQLAAKRSQVIPALIQDDSTIEVRKRTPPYNNTRKSPREDNDRRQNGRNEQSWRDNKPPRKPFDNNEGKQEWREKSNRNDHGQQREDRFNKKFDSNKNSQFERNDNSGWSNNNNFKSNDDNNDFRKKSRSDFKSNNDFNRNKKNDGGSEKSWSGSEKSNSKFRNNKHERTERKPPRHNQRSDNFNSPPNKQQNNTWNDPPARGGGEKPDYAADHDKFNTLELTGKTENVSVSWFYNPANFYCQLENSKNEFGALMREIQTAYKKRKPYDSPQIGCPVIAQFPEDNALYRGTVLEKSFSSCKVFYVDFGNVAGAKSLYRIEKKHMTLPMQAYRCSIKQISPAGDKWPDPDSFSPYFEKDSFECKFTDFEENKYNVELNHNNSSVREQLIKEGLAFEQSAPIGEPTVFDVAILIGQTIRCQLASVNNLSDILLQFKPGVFLPCNLHAAEDLKTGGDTILHNLLGQNVIVYVENVVDNRLDVVFYNNSGFKLDIYNTPDTDFVYVAPVLPTPVLAKKIHGFISHTSDTAIYVLPAIYSDEINKLLDELYSFYQNSEANVTEVGEGHVYAVWSEDGNCYRGSVNAIKEDGSVTVYYLDYGNCEDVQLSSLRILNEKHWEPHSLALEIAHTVDPSMIQQEITLDIDYINDKWTAVVEEGVQQQQQPQQEQTAPDVQPEAPLQDNIIEEKTMTITETPIQSNEQPTSLGFSVFLSHCDNPGQFYLQLSDAIDAIDELQAQLQNEAPQMPDVENVTTGILCAAPYTLDEMWYRAQVLDSDSSITTVRYVDYGNTDVLDNTQSKVKTLPAELLCMEHHAKRCSLYLSPIEEEWSAECCERFNALTADKNLTAEILHQDEKTTFVELYADGVNVSKVLIEEQLAVELQMEIGSGPCTGFVSHLNSPSEFWIQLEAACSDLEWIADQMSSAENFSQLENMEPGSLCAAIFPDDECWYRARILSNTVAGLEVLFIDYGNSCTCSNVRELPEELVLMPPLAQKCSLQKPLGLLQWSQAATEIFKEISADGITIFNINKVSQGETSIVQLQLEGVDISEKLLPVTFDGSITNIESIDDFTVKNNETQEIMEHCKMECLPGYVWNENSGKDFSNICNNNECKFKVEKVSDASVRLYEEHHDIRSEISMTRSTPVSSVHSTPRRQLLEPIQKNSELKLVEEEKSIEILKDKIDQMEITDEVCIIEDESSNTEENLIKPLKDESSKTEETLSEPLKDDSSNIEENSSEPVKDEGLETKQNDETEVSKDVNTVSEENQMKIEGEITSLEVAESVMGEIKTKMEVECTESDAKKEEVPVETKMNVNKTDSPKGEITSLEVAESVIEEIKTKLEIECSENTEKSDSIDEPKSDTSVKSESSKSSRSETKSVSSGKSSNKSSLRTSSSEAKVESSKKTSSISSLKSPIKSLSERSAKLSTSEGKVKSASSDTKTKSASSVEAKSKSAASTASNKIAGKLNSSEAKSKSSGKLSSVKSTGKTTSSEAKLKSTGKASAGEPKKDAKNVEAKSPKQEEEEEDSLKSKGDESEESLKSKDGNMTDEGNTTITTDEEMNSSTVGEHSGSDNI